MIFGLAWNVINFGLSSFTLCIGCDKLWLWLHWQLSMLFGSSVINSYNYDIVCIHSFILFLLHFIHYGCVSWFIDWTCFVNILFYFFFSFVVMLILPIPYWTLIRCTEIKIDRRAQIMFCICLILDLFFLFPAVRDQLHARSKWNW